MSMKRISFIEVGAPGLHIFSKFPVARVGSVLLSTILREKGYEVKAFIENISIPDWAFIESSELVCISTLTPTAIRAYSIGQRLKAKGTVTGDDCRKADFKLDCQVRTDAAADPVLLRLMADAGCHTVYIGFESINPKTLEQYNKKQTLEDIVGSIRSFRDHGIRIHGMFVIGADTDDIDVIKKTVQFLSDINYIVALGYIN